MLFIECTQKLASELKIKIDSAPPQADPLFEWHAHLFMAGNRKSVILMNNRTRYTIVLYGLRKEHFKNFGVIFREAVFKNFMVEEIDGPIIEKYLNNCDDIIYCKTYDRSILSQINDILYLTEARIRDYLPTERMNLIELNRENNRTPLSRLPQTYAIRAMIEALKTL